jgi:hypothetical protein
MQNQRIFYHVRLPNTFILKCEHCQKETKIGRNPPIFTLGFEYDIEKKLLLIAWAKPKKGECYIKSQGIEMVKVRLDRLIKHYPNTSYRTIPPRIVLKHLNFYIEKAKLYFKEINTEIDYWI